MTYGLVIGLTIIATLAAVGWVQRRDVDTDWLTDVEPDGYDTVISDETARNVEPVTVLTAEDARGVAARVAQRMVASGISDGLWAQVAGEAVEDEFRERGLDV